MNLPSLSTLDQQRFGVVTAKYNLQAGDSIDGALAWCAAQNVAMLIVRCDSKMLAQVQRLEQAGCRLMDTLVYYRKTRLDDTVPALPEGYRSRLAVAADGDAVEALAGRTFAGYLGHYHADPRLAAGDADLVYSSWAGSSCRSAAVADAVILIESAGEIAAFATLKVHDDKQFEGVLFGVSPDHQGKRLYATLMQLAQQWGRARAYTEMLVSTQLTNLAVQKVWCRQGFEPASSLYTFHRWFDH
jgi:GNAT superfamily N-acetyltransferase